MYRKESRGKKSNILTTRRFASLLRVRYQYFFSIIHSNLGFSIVPRSPFRRWRDNDNNNNDDDDDDNNNGHKESFYLRPTIS